MTKRFGFTLAEVLITLGIIGVVAAMTMPTLIANYHKKVYVNQLRTNVSLLSQAVKKYLADQGVDTLALTNMPNNDEELKRFFNEYLKIVNDCDGRYYVEGKYGCFNKTYSKIDKTSRPNNLSNFSCAVVVNLANGASICSDVSDATTTIDPDTGKPIYNAGVGTMPGSVMLIEIDINGLKGPNQYGRDYFAFGVNEYGVIVDPNEFDESTSFSAGPNAGFLGKIMQDGWEMKY